MCGTSRKSVAADHPSIQKKGRIEETWQRLKKKLVDNGTGKEKNELKDMFDRISAAFIQKETCFKGFSHQIECLIESSQNLARENEHLQVTKPEIIAFPSSRLRSQKTGKES